MTDDRPGEPQRPLPPLWATMRTERTVLLVVHNTTTLNRLLDVVGVVASDLRVQCLVTSDLTDPFAERLPAEVEALGLCAVPWEQARAATFDLIVAASPHGRLDELHGPLVLLSHGLGFGKYAPGSDGDGRRSVFGADPEWLLRESGPLAAAVGVPHAAQLDRLAADVPGVAASVVVVGDPTYDRMLVSTGRRGAYRAALGVDDDVRLVVVSSTWGASSTLGAWPEVAGRMLTELPSQTYRVALVVHPNVWAWHGPFQLRAWLAPCLRAGLLLVPPLEGWQATLVASDVVVGDHGSVTGYGAALGRPALLAAFPDGDVVPGSAAHEVGLSATRLERHGDLSEQIDAAVECWTPERTSRIAELVTSVPGESSARLGRLFSRLLAVDAPLVPAPALSYALPVLDGPGRP